MSKKYYFMAGLPRSGSTLLSAIIGQNPGFYAGPSSPVFSTMYVIENHFRIDPFFTGYPKIAEGNAIISNVINQYYSDITTPIIIDKNRAWAGNVRFIEGYIGQRAKIICPVRDTAEILASFIAMIHRNPYREGNGRMNIIDEQLVRNGTLINDNNRCDHIAGPHGILGQSIQSIQDGINQGYGDRMFFLEYKKLISNPRKMIQDMYDFLGEPYFEHHFDSIEHKYRENDWETYGIPDMHEIRKELAKSTIEPQKILSPYVLERCGAMDLWRN